MGDKSKVFGLELGAFICALLIMIFGVLALVISTGSVAWTWFIK